MTNYYFTAFLFSALPLAAQPTQPAPTLADTLRPAFRGTWPDSLAPLPTPGGTLRVQGQAQPARPFLTIQDQLRGVAGVQVTPYDGSPGSGQVVRIRGASQMLGAGQPLYVVDGLPALNDELTPDQVLLTHRLPSPFGGNSYATDTTVPEQHAEAGASPLQLLPPESIESVDVLAGPAAVARYGPLGANGVISIRTRRAAGTAGQPLRVRYAAYAGVQQVRQRYELLGASEFATIANEAYRNQSGGLGTVPFANTQLGEGTDWQREAYHLAGLQQHQLSLEGRTPRTGYLLSADYRQQSGILRGSDLSRYGLRLALDHRATERLTLRATVAGGQTDQRLPYNQGPSGAVRAALLAPPTASVRDAQGAYAGYEANYSSPSARFDNPLAISDYTYRQPRTRRLLSQVAADYQPAPGLTVQAAVNLQLTQLDALSYYPRQLYRLAAPTLSEQYGSQMYQNNQLAARLAVHYERRLGLRHRLGLEVDYQYQQANYRTRTEGLYTYYGPTGSPAGRSSFYNELTARPRLHRPWARLHYALDSTLTAEVGLSYAHFKEAEKTEYYPSAQLSWHPRPLALGTGQPVALTLWVGAARTSVFGYGYGLFGPATLVSPPSPSYTLPFARRTQGSLRTDQLEVGLRLGQPASPISGQLVAYQRQTDQALLSTLVALPTASGYSFSYLLNEGRVRNQGLELTLAGSWRAGRVQGTTRLAGSLNRNRLQGDEYARQTDPAFDNHPVGTFYGWRQDGLTPDGALRYQDTDGDGSRSYRDQQYLGSGIPAQLASLGQQLRLGRLALDAQLDGQFGYQVLNSQLAFLDVPTGSGNSATTVRDYWTPARPTTTVPAPGRTGYLATYTTDLISDRLLENGSHVRLSSLTLTYRLRQTATQDLSIWVGAQNLFVLTSYRGYDPNVSSGGSVAGLAGQDYGAVPVPRTWLLGVRASL
jgi:hypothetical protein